MRVLDKDNQEIDLKQTFEDDDDDMGLTPVDDGAFSMETPEDDLGGFSVEHPEEDEEDFFPSGSFGFDEEPDDLSASTITPTIWTCRSIR